MIEPEENIFDYFLLVKNIGIIGRSATRTRGETL